MNFVSQLGVADEEDRKRTGRTKKYRINFRGICKVKLGDMNRRDKNPLIKLEGEDTIYYGIVATYMNKKRRIVKVDADAAKSMLTTWEMIFLRVQLMITGRCKLQFASVTVHTPKD